MNYRDQLEQILDASRWSQERLAAELSVSFPAINAWLNKRAVPRAKAQVRINELYLSIVGSSSVSESDLIRAKQVANRYLLSARQNISHQAMLDKLTLHLTYHTNTIDGSTMTLADVENVIFDNKVLFEPYGDRTVRG